MKPDGSIDNEKAEAYFGPTDTEEKEIFFSILNFCHEGNIYLFRKCLYKTDKIYLHLIIIFREHTLLSRSVHVQRTEKLRKKLLFHSDYCIETNFIWKYWNSIRIVSRKTRVHNMKKK